jgi:HlyD family secretion protein
MKKLNLTILTLSSTAALATFFYIGQRVKMQEAQRAADFASTQVASSPKDGVSAFGTLEPADDVHILAGPMNELGGAPRVKSILVSEGTRVLKGQVLVIFDNKERLYAEKAKIQREIIGKSAEIQILSTNIKRFAPLSLEGSFPLSDYEDKKVRLATFESQLQELVGSLKAIEARIDTDTVIRSPISGYVLRINARPGERSGSQGVIEIGNISKMQAVIQVDESDINSIATGQKALIKSENGSFDGTLHGFVSSVGLAVSSRKKLTNNPSIDSDPEQRVIDVRILLVPDSSDRVKRLTGAKVSAFIEHQS